MPLLFKTYIISLTILLVLFSTSNTSASGNNFLEKDFCCCGTKYVEKPAAGINISMVLSASESTEGEDAETEELNMAFMIFLR